MDFCNYEREHLLSRGGMGEVYSAVHLPTRQMVALKVMKPEIAEKLEFNERFRRESDMLAGMNHANIVRIYEYGECNGVPFMAMELLRGETLRSNLEADPFPPLPDVCRIGCEVLAALGHVHRIPIIHRDLSPSNIFLCTTGVVKILDFGIARNSSNEKTLTQQGAVMGKPEYMSPEQAQGFSLGTDNPLAVRSDLYSLGIVLYQMVCGHLPFTGETTMQVLYQQVHKPLPPIPAKIPADIRRIIEKALQKKPENRYRSSVEMRTELEKAWQRLLQPAEPGLLDKAKRKVEGIISGSSFLSPAPPKAASAHGVQPPPVLTPAPQKEEEDTRMRDNYSDRT